MALAVDKINAILISKFGLPVIRGGQNHESPPLPYIQYDLVIEDKYNNYQILKNVTEETPGTIEGEYKNPTYTTFQYGIIGDEGQADVVQIENIYNYMTTAGFKIALNAENIYHTIMSDVTELSINKQDFYERRFIFEVRFAWSNNFTEDETIISVIETADAGRIPAGPSQ